MIKELYFTHVETLGGLLLAWGQCDKAMSEQLENNIKQVAHLLEQNVITNPVGQLTNAKLCLMKLKNNEYYRVKILSLNKLELRLVSVFLVDYGNTFEVRLESLRLIDTDDAMYPFITSVPHMASLFYIAEVQAPGHMGHAGVWPPPTLDFLRQTLTSKVFKCDIIDARIVKNLIHIYIEGNVPITISKVLIERDMAQHIAIPIQEALIQALSHSQQTLLAGSAPVIKPQASAIMPNMNTAPVVAPIPPVAAMPNAIISPPLVPPPAQPMPIFRRTAPAITVSQFTSVKLPPGSRHAVYISHVEEGVFAFAVQLKGDADDVLPDLMLEINQNYKPAPVEGVLMPGTLCLARYTSDKLICRAVITDVMGDKVKVYYVDFGNWEYLPPSEVFSIPPKYLTQKVMASKFSLAGVKDDPDWKLKAIKDYFQEYADQKEFIMDVIANETSSLTQYCNLYYEGQNVRDILKAQIERIVPFAYRDPPNLTVGSLSDVIVTFVESPMRFFIQLTNFKKDLDTVMSAIDSFCNSARGASGMINPDDASLNLPCCAFFDQDQKWYRAQILDNSDTSALIVRYVDFGNEETVPLNSLRRIEKRLVTEFCVQAIECCLKGFESVATTPEDEVIVHFEATTLEQPFKMKVIGALSTKTILVDLFNSQNQSISSMMKNYKPEAEELPVPPVTVKTEPVQNHEEWNNAQNSTEQKAASNEDNWRKPRNEDNWRNNGSGDRKFGGGFNSRGQDNDRFDRDGGFKGRREGGFQRNEERPSRNQSDWSGQDGGFKGHNRDGGFKSQTDRGFHNKNDNSNSDDWSSGQKQSSSNHTDWSGGQSSNKDTDWSGDRPKSSSSGDRPSFQDRGDSGFGGRPKRFDGERKFGGDRHFNDKKSDDGFEGKPWKSRDDFSSRPFKPTREPGFPAGSTFKRDAWDVGAENEVQVSWSVTPSEFYVQLLSTHSSFRAMMQAIPQEYRKREKAEPSSLNVGDCVIARSDEDRALYRAQIKESSFGTLKVEFVDYGNCGTADEKFIWNISSDHCELPCQAFTCSLNGIAPADESGEWPKDFKSKFDKLFEADKYLCTVVSHDEEKNLYHVNLLNLTDNTDVAQKLIEEGVAVSTLQQPASLESEDPVDLSLLLNQTHWAHMCAVVCKSQFFVHLEKSKIDSIQAAVDTYMASYLNNETAKLAESKIRHGEYCIASPDGESWYRAQITDLNGTTGVIVTFIDYGDTADVARDSLYTIYDDLLISPGQAIECCLPDDADVDTEKLENYMENEDTAIIIRILSLNETNKLSVKVFDRNGQDLFSRTEEKISPYCSLPVCRQREKVYVTHAENTETEKGNFIVLQYASYADALGEFLDTIHEYAESAEQLEEPMLELVCVAKSPADEQWYRARLVTMDPEILVEYLDYGNSEVVPLENLRKIDSSLAYPPLFAVSPVYLPISSFDASELLTTYADTEFIANFKFSDGKWFANLETADGVYVSRSFVESGKAKELDPSPYAQPPSTLAKWQKTEGESSVICTYVDDVNKFYIQLASECDELEELQSNLQQDILKMMPLIGKSSSIFAAKYVADDTWYRAEFSSDESVRFIDYGNEDAIDEIKKLPAKYLSNPFSVACTLPVTPFKGTEWSEEVIEKFRSLVVEAEELLGEVISVEGNVATVRLSINGKEVSNMLIEENLAAAKPLEVTVSHINSLQDFYAQVDLPASDKMVEKLANAESWNAVDDLTEGIIVAAKFNEDDLFYRAKILRATEDSTQVFFIDYGNLADVTEIKELPDDLKTIEPLAAHCCLDFSPTVIAPETVEKFMEFSSFGETLFKLKLISGNLKMGLAKVELILDDKSVTRQLLEFNAQNIEVTARMSFVNSLSSFYIQHISNDGLLEKVTTSLETGSELEQASEVTEGLLYAVKFEDDGLYYRAKGLPDSSVFFIDYGNTATSSDLRILPEEILNIPPLAKHCTLHIPAGVELPESSLDLLYSFLEGTELQIKYLSFEDPRCVMININGQSIVDQMLQTTSKSTETAQTNDEIEAIEAPAKKNAWFSAMEADEINDSIEIIEAVELSDAIAASEAIELSNAIAASEAIELSNAIAASKVVEAAEVTDVITAGEAHEFNETSHPIVHINSPNDFYIHKDFDGLDTIRKILDDNSLLQSIPLEDIAVGALVAAKFVDDGAWYRSEVLSKDETSPGFCVLFIDYGNQSVATEFAVIPEAISEVAPLALKYAIQPPRSCDEWPSSVNERFVEIVEDNGYECEILGDENSGFIDLKCGGIVISQELLKLLDSESGAVDTANIVVKTEKDDDMVLEETSFEPSNEFEAEEADVSTIHEATESPESPEENEKGLKFEKNNYMSEEFSEGENSPSSCKAGESFGEPNAAENNELSSSGIEYSAASSFELKKEDDTSCDGAGDLIVKQNEVESSLLENAGIESSPASHSEFKENDSVDITDIEEKIDALNLEVNDGKPAENDVEFLKETIKSNEVIDLRESPAKADSNVEDIDDCDRDYAADVNHSPCLELSESRLEEAIQNGNLEFSELAIKEELVYEDPPASKLETSESFEFDESIVSLSSANNTVIEFNGSSLSENMTPIKRTEDKIVAGSISRGDMSEPPVPKILHEEKIVAGAISGLDLDSLENESDPSTVDESVPKPETELNSVSRNSNEFDNGTTSAVYHEPIPLDEKICVQSIKGSEVSSENTEAPKSVPIIPLDEKSLPAHFQVGVDSD
ncbi:unnamed protein product [Bemisia tabaci]|uniref:Tudor domain-containing protein n=1 Tax=Bemisia tabaci TaxID=7038 RepID=A0A9P0A6W9_BEMTA|nr:unnamed protein product [Bemisia tabaci]